MTRHKKITDPAKANPRNVPAGFNRAMVFAEGGHEILSFGSSQRWPTNEIWTASLNECKNYPGKPSLMMCPAWFAATI
jgi:hypothetical protein